MDEKHKITTTAPYNFVPLSDKVVAVYTDKKDLPQHNKIYGEGEKKLSGEITFSIEAVTDIAIGGSKEGKSEDEESKEGEFYKDTYGKYAIPGSSLRGLFRSNMQILGASALGDDIEDFRFLYRKVGGTNSTLSKKYKGKLLNIAEIKEGKTKDKARLYKEYLEFRQQSKEEEEKQVYYIDLKGKYFFDYTKYFRAYFKYSIKQRLPDKHTNFVYDYAKSIFGYSNNNAKDGQEESYKGRVYFEDATLSSAPPKNLKKIKLTLESPKPSDYFDYLQQNDYDRKSLETITSYDDEFEIRGIKQYWFKEPKTPMTSKEIKDMSEFSYLGKGACFQAKVRFKNLTKDELGLLLWCIRLEKESQQNIGKAKAYGYGRIKIDKLEVKMLDVKKMYSLDYLDFNPFYTCEQAEIDAYIKGYKEKIGESNKDSRNAFFIMKNTEKVPNEENTVYMALENYKETKRHPLPTPDNVIPNREIQKNKHSNEKSIGHDNSYSKKDKRISSRTGNQILGAPIDLSNIVLADPSAE